MRKEPNVAGVSMYPLYNSLIPASFKRSSLSLCISFVLAGQAYAGPDGGEVVGGAGSISRSGNTTTINQATDRMAIDWQRYDVGANERVHYIQPGSSSVSLNRILSNTGSNIQGRIDANGHVILMNPHGILFGKDSVVNAGGILASGLNIDATDFMNGDFTFSAIEGTEGFVINRGIINAALGGSVSLIGKEVKNDGLISAQLGSVTFAAGREAVVSFDANSMVNVRITKALLEDDIGVDSAVVNSGEILAENGRILLTASTSRDVFSQAVNSGELDSAYSVVMDDDGTFTIGGGANVVNTGVLSASGDAGGAVVLLGENVTHSGEIHTDSYLSGVAGMVEIHSVDTTLLTGSGVVTANADQGVGGDIKLLGDRVGLVEQSRVTADGAIAGGQVLVGGDYRGENSDIRNASAAYVGIDTRISASATEIGDGGKVILWGNDRLTALGRIDAVGAEYGDGGFVETSSAVVSLDPHVNVSSEFGEGGTWLIDPYNITIQDGGTTNLESSVVAPFDTVFLPNSDDSIATSSILTTESLVSSLAGGNNVLVETTGAGGQEGDITLADELDYTGQGNASLTLRAHDDIQINAIIEDGNTLLGRDSLNLALTANYNNGGASYGGGDITIANGISIKTEGGNFTATGSNFTSTGATINVSSDLRTINVDEPNERQLIGNIDIDIDGDAFIGNVVIGDTRTSSEPENSATTSLFDVDATNIIRNGSTNYGVGDEVANHTTNLTYTASGDISFTGATADNTGSGNDILNVTLNADSDAGEDSDEGNDDDGVITIDGNTSLWLTGGAFLASGHDFILGSATTAGLIGTEGGTFDVGTSLAPLSGDFNSNFDNTLIITNFGTGPAGNISIHADGDVDLGGLDNHTHSNRDVAAWNSTSSTNFTLSVNAGDDLSLNQDFDFGRLVGTGTGNTLTFNAGNSVPSGGGDSGIRVNATLFSSGSDYSNITFGVVGNDTNLTNFTNSAVINSNGGSVNLFVDGAISVESNIFTNGGNFTAGDTTGSVFSTSFDNYVDDTGGTISTSMDDGAGDITITTVLDGETNGNVTLGTLSVADNEFYSQGGNIRVSSGNNITLESDYNFNATGGTTTDRVLELRAHGNVTVNGSISDSVASGYDTLNVSLLANDDTGDFATGTGAVNVDSNIYTGGGNFIATGASFDSGGVLIDTDNSNSSGGSTSTNGGNATITTSGVVTLGSIQTDTDTDSTGNFTVAGSSISNASGAVINVAGTPTFTGASGNLSIDLSNDGHSFGNTIAIGSDQATLALGDINIDTGGTAVNIDATTISQLTDTDSITLNGALLQINADSVQTQDIDTSGAVNSAGGGVTVTALNGILSLGTVTTNGGTVGDNVVGQNAGAVTLAATSDISVGEIQAVGSDGHDDENNGTDQYNGGAGANITITSSGAITLAGASSDGGNGHAQQNQNDDDASGGDAGYIYVNTAGQLNLGGDITARGGRLWDNDRSESRNGTTNLHAVSRAGITLTASSIILTDNIRVDATLTPEFFDPDDSERSSNHVEDARSPNIIFSGTIDGTTPGEERLNVYGADITFSQNLGAATRLGAVTIGEADTIITNAIGPLAASVNAGTRTINAASLSVTASDFVSSDINTVGLTGLVGGQIVIDVDTTLTTGSLTTIGGAANTSGTDQNGKAGGRIDLDAADIEVGAINASGSNANSGVGGDAGLVTIDATENNGTPTIRINGDIATEGGTGAPAGSARQSQLTLAGTNVTSASVFLNFSSTTNFLTSSVNITGTSSNFDTLTGPSTNAFWVSDENNGGAINNAATSPVTVIDFSGFEILQGGSGADDFTLGHDFTSVRGGSGLDVFRVTTDINTRLFGEGDVDTFHLNGGVTDSDGDTRDVNGGGGNDIFNVAGNITVTIEGDGGTADVVTLVNTTGPHSWSVLTDNSGTLNSNIDFQTVERLNGANGDADGGDDQFTFSNSFSGPFGGAENSINARGGDNDSVLVTNATNPISVTLGENLFGVVSAETIASNGANNGAAFTLQLNSDATAAGSTTTWTINGVNDGIIDNGDDPAIKFENFASLQGNQANDSFEVQTGGSIVSVSGIRDDGSLQTNESNALSFADGANIWTISGQHAGNVTGDHATSFTQVQSVTGAGSDTLNGRDQNNTWNIGTTNTVALTVATGSPTDTLTFSGMNTLNGGSAEDTFNVNATVDWLLNGAEGDDVFEFGASGALFGAGSGIDGGVAGSEGDRLIARDAANNWAIRAIDDSDTNTVADSTNDVYVRDFKNIDVLEGSDTSADVFDFAIVSNNTIIDAGTSTGDIADYADVTGNVLVTVSDTAVSGIDQFIGNNDGRTVTTNNTTLTFASGSGDSVAWRIFDDAAIADADGINDGDINGTVAFLNVNNLTGGDGNDTFTFDQTANSISGLSGTITGGGNSGLLGDRIVARNEDINWVVAPLSGSESLTYENGLDDGGDPPVALESITTFTDIETLDSGTGDDTFTVGQLATVTLNAGGGTDTIALPDEDLPITLGNPVGGLTLNGFEQINAFEGRNNSLTVTSGEDVVVDWQITSANSGSVAVGNASATTFTNFQILNGGGGDDTFDFSGGGSVTRLGTANGEVNGNGGDNTVIGQAVATTWSIDGVASGSVTNTDTSVAYVEHFSGVNALQGQSTIDRFTLTAAGSFFGTINGVGGADTLTINSVAGERNEWRLLDASTTGALPDQVRRLDPDNNVSTDIDFFNSISLTGGTGTDEFIFLSAGNFGGTINANDNVSANDIDVVDLSNIDTLEVPFSASSIYGVQNADQVIGNGENSTLMGLSTGTNTWRVSINDSDGQAISGADGVNDGTLSNDSTSLQFINFANLSGGNNAVDNFEIGTSGSVTGTITGGTPGTGNVVDTVTTSSDNSLWALTAFNAGSVNDNDFTEIESVIANGSGDTLRGINQANLWRINDVDEGTVAESNNDNPISFEGMENLSGHQNSDVFVLVDNATNTGQITGTITGTDAAFADVGVDELTVQSQGGDQVVWTLDQNTDDETTGSVALRVNQSTLIERFNGGNGNDRFEINDAGVVAIVDGNDSASDTVRLKYSDVSQWQLGATDSEGDAVDDTVGVIGSGSVTMLDVEIAEGSDTGGDNFTINGPSGDLLTLRGRGGNDTFTVDASVNPDTNMIVEGGGGDSDELVGGNRNNSWVFGGSVTEEADTLNYLSDTNPGIQFSQIEDFTGGTGNDDFELRSGTVQGDIDGGSSGVDTLRVVSASGASVSWTIDGLNSGTVDGVNGDFSRITDLTGGEGADRFTFTQTTASIFGLIDGGEAVLSDPEVLDPNTDVLDVSIFTAGVVVELGPDAAAGSLVDGTAGLPNVNVHNMEELRAAAGDEVGGDENNQWLAIAGDAAIDWNLAMAGATSEHNEGRLQEIVSVKDPTVIANTQTQFFNFGSIKGGGGGARSNIITEGDFDDRNLSGEYQLGSGERFLVFPEDGFHIVEINALVVGVEGNDNVLIRIASDSEFNGANEWLFYDENAGSFTADYEDDFSFDFSGVSFVEGGTGNDTFTFADDLDALGNPISGAITGAINGGGGYDIVNVITASQAFDFGVSQLSSGADYATSYPSPLSEDVFLVVNRDGVTDLVNIDALTIDASNTASLISGDVDAVTGEGAFIWNIGSDGSTSQIINDANAQSMTFSGVDSVAGGGVDDTFNVLQLGLVTDVFDGGGGRDTVNIDSLSALTVSVDVTQTKDVDVHVVSIENLEALDRNHRLAGSAESNTWAITGRDDGELTYNNGESAQTLAFINVANLDGGASGDTFEINGGSVSGEIVAGNGNNQLNVHLASGMSGEVNFTGGDDVDWITIDGGDNETRFASNYSASVVDSVPHGTLEYSISTANVANNYHVNFTDVETVNDRVFTNTMTINNVIGRDDIVTIANNRFGLDGFIDIDITNKNSLDIVGEQTDQVIIEGRVSLNDAFSVTNASVSGLDANAIIDANRMISFNTTGAIGSVDNRLSIETNNVSFNAVNGDVYVNQTGDLIIAQLSNPAAIIDIDATGTITDGADLSSANAIRLESDGTITLDNNNSLLGVVTLLATNGDVAFTNGTTRLGDVSAQNLSLTTTGNIDDEGLIQVANATTINGSATSVINLNGENNTFNNVTVTNAGSFFLNDSSANGVTVQGNASDNFIVQASNSITANAVSAKAIELSSANAGITIQNTVNAQNSVDISGEGVDINGSITVTSSADSAVLVDARTGDLNIRSAISADAGVLGDIELIGQTVQQFAGAVISGRNVFVDSDTDVNLAANITATEILDVNAGTEIVMGNGLTSTLTQAGTLTFTAVDNIVTQQIVADSVSLISTTGSIDQQGDITAGAISITANAGEFESQAGTVLSVNTGDLMVLAQGANIRGDIQANENAVTFDIDQSFLLSADISAANVNVETGAQITMTSGSQIDSSADITFIAGSDIELSQLNAEDGTASLSAGGSVTDNNGEASNISAMSLFSRSETGFGATADNANINTSVANIDVQNASGAIGISNDQEVSITSLITNGNIRFVNTEGNVILSNMVEEDYDRDFNVTDARQAGGVINGNYSFGNVSILVSNGYLAAEPGANSNRPELVGDIIDVTTSNGFGFDRQLVVYAQTELIVSGPGIRPIWAFGEPPLFGLTTDSDLIDPSIVGGLSELLVEVEEAADIDPAIFTNVNNYLYDNISIRMPRDQIYDDDEYYEEEGDEDKEHDEGYYY